MPLQRLKTLLAAIVMTAAFLRRNINELFFVELLHTFHARIFQWSYQIFLCKSPKGPPFIFVVYFAKEWMLKNFQRAPFYMFRHYATYGRPKKFKNFEKNRIFFSIFPQTGTVEENT